MDCKKCTLLTFILMACFCFTGIIFGYAPLLLMLEKEGVYDELCKPGESRPCIAQQERFNLCFTLACFILSFLSLPAGIFLDKFGPRYTMMFSSVFVFIGLLGFAYADSKHFDVFLPSFISLASGGIMIMMSSFPVSFLLPEYQAGILASISCLFDASSLIFSIFLQLNIHFQFTRKQLFIGYAFLSLFILLPPIVLWVEMEKLILHKKDNDDNHNNDFNKGKVDENNDNYNSITEKIHFQDMDDLQLNDVADDGNNNNNNITSIKNEFIPVHQRNFFGQIKSFEFLFVMLFASMQMLKANTYLGCVVELLDSYGDAASKHYYSKVFSFVLPAGIVCVPLIDRSIHYFGLVGSLTLTTIVGLIFSGVALVPDLQWQIVTFATFTIFRAFLYAVMSTFNAQIFGLETLGRITGIVFTSSSIMGLLQYPLVDITNQEFNGDFKYLLYFLCALSLPTVVLIVLFMRHRKKYYGEIVVKSPNTSIQGSPSVAGCARLDRSNSYGVDVLTKSPGRTGGFALWSGIDNVNEQSSLLEENNGIVGGEYHTLDVPEVKDDKNNIRMK